MTQSSAPVHDLEVGNAGDRSVGEFDGGGGRGDSVVVREESIRLGQQGFADPTIDLAAVAEVCTDVALEQASSVTAVELERGPVRGAHTSRWSYRRPRQMHAAPGSRWGPFREVD